MTSDAQGKMNTVIDALPEGCYDPYAQMYGCLPTEDDILLTRRDGARELIKLIDKEDLVHFITENAPNM